MAINDRKIVRFIMLKLIEWPGRPAREPGARCACLKPLSFAARCFHLALEFNYQLIGAGLIHCFNPAQRFV